MGRFDKLGPRPLKDVLSEPENTLLERFQATFVGDEVQQADFLRDKRIERQRAQQAEAAKNKKSGQN